MNLDRLVGILAVLLNNERITAPALAEKFEVSRRTINRDIERLCRAGIPIVTEQGRNGGIHIMEGYAISRTLFTGDEMQAILAGLRSLDSVCDTRRYQRLMEKLPLRETEVWAGDGCIRVDLASWYYASLAPKIEQIRSAINAHVLIEFDYISPRGDSFRRIEPYILLYQWSSWYVFGFCRQRMEFRLFKLNRMQNLRATEAYFEPRELPEAHFSARDMLPPAYEITALVAPEMRWRLVDDFGPDSFTADPDGRLRFTFRFSDREGALTWLMTFGDRAEVVSPEALRVEISHIVEKLAQMYAQS